LLDWIWETRNPTATTPLLVEIGPGRFGSMYCPFGKGFVTFSGSGRGQTIFGTTINSFTFGGDFHSCNQLVFEHMTIAGTFIGVKWIKGGSSSWTDVEILGGYSAWYDTRDPNSGNTCPGQEGTHKFFGSTLKVTTGAEVPGGNVFVNSCGKNWLWGSEIVLDATTTSAGNSNGFAGITSGGAGNEVHLYGSNLRLFSGNGSALQSITAIEAASGAQVHSHGTGIDVIATKPISVTALSAGSGGSIHASESAYVLEAAVGGIKTRISKDANPATHVHAPHLWAEHDAPPSITSVTGADMAVVTSGPQPQLVIYSSTCNGNGGPWVNVATGTCL
jgi:hypothetical protein